MPKSSVKIKNESNVSLNNENRTGPSQVEIAARAYEIYLRNGAQEGRDLDNWLQAEAELRASSAGANLTADGSARPSASSASNGSSSIAMAASAPTTPVLTNSVLAETSPIATITRSSTPRRSGKRETAGAR